jgi:hypothetical protein
MIAGFEPARHFPESVCGNMPLDDVAVAAATVLSPAMTAAHANNAKRSRLPIRMPLKRHSPVARPDA